MNEDITYEFGLKAPSLIAQLVIFSVVLVLMVLGVLKAIRHAKGSNRMMWIALSVFVPFLGGIATLLLCKTRK